MFDRQTWCGYRCRVVIMCETASHIIPMRNATDALSVADDYTQDGTIRDIALGTWPDMVSVSAQTWCVAHGWTKCALTTHFECGECEDRARDRLGVSFYDWAM